MSLINRIKDNIDNVDAILQESVYQAREMTPEEIAKAKRYLDETDVLDKMNNLIGAPINKPTKPDPNDGWGGYAYKEATPVVLQPPPGMGPRGKTFNQLFPEIRLDNGGWQPGEFLQVMASGRHDPRLIKAAMVEGQPSSGGFMVPVDLEAYVMDVSLFTEIVRNQAQTWPMQSSTLKVPGWDILNMAGGDMAGFTMQFLGEGGTATKQTGKVRLVELNTGKGMIYGEASGELAMDAPNFQANLQYILAQAVSYGYDKAFLTGNGSGMPLGALSATNSLIVVDKRAGQEAGTIAYENLADMWSRMYPAGRSRSIWVANSDTLPQLLTLGIAIGMGGTFYPVLRESDGGYSIFGRPCYFSPALPSLGSQGDIMLADFSQYAIGMRSGMSLEFSIHPGFQSDMLSFRVITRFDGQPLWNKYHTPENGATQSWCVTLQARA